MSQTTTVGCYCDREDATDQPYSHFVILFSSKTQLPQMCVMKSQFLHLISKQSELLRRSHTVCPWCLQNPLQDYLIHSEGVSKHCVLTTAVILQAKNAKRAQV